MLAGRKAFTDTYLQGKEIDRLVYMEPPAELKKPDKLWKLKKSVYGMNDTAGSDTSRWRRS